MKKSMKLCSLLLVIVMIMGLVACGSNASESTGNNSSPSNTASGNAVNLKVWAWDDNVPAVKSAAELYNSKTGSNIVLDVSTIGNAESREKLTTVLSAGDKDSLPDIVLMEDTAIAQFVSSYKDAFVDMTDYNISWDKLVASKTSLSVLEDRHFAIPFDSGASIACYRVDILEQAGYTIKDLTDINWSTFIKIASDVYTKTGKYLLADNAKDMNVAKNILSASDSSYFDSDGNVNFKDNKVMAEVLAVTKQLVEAKALFLAGSWDEYIACLNDGTAAGVINGGWIIGNIAEAKDQAGLWDITNIPALEVASGTHYTNSGGSSWLVMSKSKNTKDAINFLSETICGSYAQEYWEKIAADTGYVTVYLPVLESGLYDNLEHEFYGKGVYSKIAACAKDAPKMYANKYFQEGYTTFVVAAANVLAGADINKELENAQSAVEFTAGK